MAAQPPENQGVYDANALHGQNRAGVELGDDDSFEEYVAARPIDTHPADELLDEEGDEMRARMHARGNDVIEPDSEAA